MPQCTNCNYTDFYVLDGYYYCSSCHFAQKDVLEEVQDKHTTGASSKKIRKVSKKVSEKESSSPELLSWEVYNFILKGLVEELICFGATVELKIVVLQLWASYLRKQQIAFHESDTVHFGITCKKRDLELICNKSFQEISTSEDLLKLKQTEKATNKKQINKVNIDEHNINFMSQQKRQLTLMKRKLVNKELSQERNDMEQSLLSQTLEDLSVTKDESLSESVCWSKEATETIEKFKSSTKTLEDKTKKELLKKLILKKRVSSSHLCPSVLIGIVQLGMILTKQRAQIGDTIRWAKEDSLSYQSYGRLIPEGLKIDSSIETDLTQKKLFSHLSVLKSIIGIAKELSIQTITQPDYFDLTARFCSELQLPDELVHTVHMLLELCPPEPDITLTSSFDTKAMSYIIVTMKMVFGLDGITERKLSDLADCKNRNQKKLLEKPFFSWNAWVKYIVCRRELVSNFHFPTRLQLSSTSYDKNNSSFFSYCDRKYVDRAKITKKYWNTERRRPLNTEICTVLNLLNTSDSYPDIKFPVTLTPMLTYTNVLVQYHCDMISSEVLNILKQSFTTHHLLSQDMFGKSNDMETVDDGCLRKFKISDYFKLPFYSYLRTSRNPLIDVSIVKQSPKQNSTEFATSSEHSQEEKEISDFSYSLKNAAGHILNPNILVNDLPDNSMKASKKRKIMKEKCSNESSVEDNIGSKHSQINNKFSDFYDGLESMAKNKTSNKRKRISLNESSIEDNTRKHSQKNKEFSNFCDDLESSVTVNVPYRCYWVLHGNFRQSMLTQPSENFDIMSKKFFSSSFLWLLNECSRTISINSKDLYHEVTNTEILLMNLLEKKE